MKGNEAEGGQLNRGNEAKECNKWKLFQLE